MRKLRFSFLLCHLKAGITDAVLGFMVSTGTKGFREKRKENDIKGREYRALVYDLRIEVAIGSARPFFLGYFTL